MIRCTIEFLPGGSEDRATIIGLVEIANIGGTDRMANYKVVLKKCPPFSGALRAAWRKGVLNINDIEDEDFITGKVEDHPRQARGVYDLLYRALKACDLERRIPTKFRDEVKQ